jgi:hypothetical protein
MSLVKCVSIKVIVMACYSNRFVTGMARERASYTISNTLHNRWSRISTSEVQLNGCKRTACILNSAGYYRNISKRNVHRGLAVATFPLAPLGKVMVRALAELHNVSCR